MMPQTYEALDHARAAKVPIVIALNKIDLDSANTNLVMQQLAESGLTPDEWDGDTLVIPVSAKEQVGIEDLLEAILLTSEEIVPSANPKASPSGTILEARLEKGRGVMTTIIVQNGSLQVGDTLLVGDHYGRIKAMYDFTGKSIKTADPSKPVSVSGLNGIPGAGEQFEVVESEKIARRIIDMREDEGSRVVAQPAPISLDEFFNRLQEGEAQSLNLILKADVQGSLEPLVNSLEQLSSAEVTLQILHSSTGNVTENDIYLASASDAVVLGFNVDIDSAAKVAAASEQVEINIYSIIYKLIEDVDKAMKGLLAPEFVEVIIGRAEVRDVFQIKSVGAVAGSYMRSGEARRNARGRVIRGSQLLYTGDVGSLKHLQDNVREVRAGFEFGVSLEGWTDYAPDDIIEFFIVERASS
jgi:translation initiation factor IF-2